MGGREVNDPFKDTRDPLVRSMERNERLRLIDAHLEAIKELKILQKQLTEVRRLADGNVTGCGTCHSIREYLGPT
jgi:hypothetical protein